MDTQKTVAEGAPKSVNQSQIASAIVLAGLIIAGAILIKDKPMPNTDKTSEKAPVAISSSDRVRGDRNAKLTVILYEDFQCPFCGRFHADAEKMIVEDYVNTGKANFVYRDFAFLGNESIKSAEATWCANDQDKFWEFHDYLYEHQNGENTGAFSNVNLKSFAKVLGLDQKRFDDCLDTGKYTNKVNESTSEGRKAGVIGTPKGFILKAGKVVDTIDGAFPAQVVKEKMEQALK